MMKLKVRIRENVEDFQVGIDIKCHELKTLIKQRFIEVMNSFSYKLNSLFDLLLNGVRLVDFVLLSKYVMNTETDIIEVHEKPKSEVQKLQAFVSQAPTQISQISRQKSEKFFQSLKDKTKAKKENPLSRLQGFFLTAPKRISDHTKSMTSNLTNKIKSARSSLHQTSEIGSKTARGEPDVKNEDHPSVIHLEENEEFKNQNETVINILDDMNHKKLQLAAKRYYQISSSQLLKNPLPLNPHQPSPDAIRYKERFDRAKKLVQSPDNKQQAQQLVKKLELQRKEIDRKRKEHYLQQSKVLNQSIELHKRQREILAESVKERRRLEIQKKLEEDKQRRFFRKQINSESNKLIKALQREIQDDKVFKVKQDEEIKSQELQKRKIILEKKRELYRPISLQSISDHKRRHDEQIKLLRLEKEREKIERDIEKDKMNLKVQRSKFTTIIEIEDRYQRNFLEQQKQHKKTLAQRKVKYGEIVKDMFKPEIHDKQLDQRKKELLDLSRQNYYEFDEFVKAKEHATKLKNSQSEQARLNGSELDAHLSNAYFRGFLQADENLRKIKQTLDTSKNNSITKDRYNSPTDQTLNESSKVLKMPYLYNRIMSDPKVSQSSVLKEQPLKKQIDYLKELRENRQQRELKLNKKYETANTIKQDRMTPKEVYQTAMSSITKLETKAQKYKKEKNMEDEADALYINSIKAKIALLEQLGTNS